MYKILLIASLIVSSSFVNVNAMDDAENAEYITRLRFPVPEDVKKGLIDRVIDRVPETKKQAEALFKKCFPNGSDKHVLKNIVYDPREEPPRVHFAHIFSSYPEYYRVIIGAIMKHEHANDETVFPDSHVATTCPNVLVHKDTGEILVAIRGAENVIDVWKRIYRELGKRLGEDITLEEFNSLNKETVEMLGGHVSIRKWLENYYRAKIDEREKLDREEDEFYLNNFPNSIPEWMEQ